MKPHKKKQQIEFIYISFDDSIEIINELASFNKNYKLRNLHFYSVDKEKMLDNSGLVNMGYPVVFYVSKNDTIVRVGAQGWMNKSENYLTDDIVNNALIFDHITQK